MKFRNCFIDGQGRIFKDETLQKAVETLPVISFVLTDELMDEVIRWKLVNFHDYLNHFRRVINADLSVPIILRSDGMIMDGRHRILKAYYEGLRTLPAKQFETDPEPDFVS